jgi:hypothetical protein
MSRFAFRQRVGKINWNAVTSIDLDELLEDVKLNELQSVLDIVTFCSFSPTDVRHAPIESTSKLVNIFQLMIEYLLHCQDTQNQLVRHIHDRNSTLKRKCQLLAREVSCLKEDAKIYQRQLAILRNSVGQRQRAADPKTTVPVDNGMNALMTSVLQNERDHREFLRVLLDEQRLFFAQELERLASSSRESKAQPQQGPNIEDTMRGFVTQIENYLSKAVESMRPAVDAQQQNSSNWRVEGSSAAKDAAYYEQEAILEERARQISRREKELNWKLAQWEEKRAKEESELAKARYVLSASQSHGQSGAEAGMPGVGEVIRLRSQSRIVGASIIKKVINQGRGDKEIYTATNTAYENSGY